ncbi:MAG: phosphoenolpyruvate carboxykinase (ATP) [Magnetococcales bacterium]|nr:phosphoenolpyruvate carboxykinase (ATP) [Magnetococcales bacterium]MBF0115025.1 phosphoenolpyruvate carboxykinase (ATP) [Magnetococcales bacterium]
MVETALREQRSETIRQALAEQGLVNVGNIHLDYSTPELLEQVIHRREGRLAVGGALVVATGLYTGRSANDKYIVEEPSSREQVAWGKGNRPFSPEQYERLRRRVMAFFQERDLFIQECRVGADPRYQQRIRVITQWAWQSMFARSLFIHPRTFNDTIQIPDYTLIVAPGFKALPEEDGTRSEVFIVLHPGRREIMIAGTGYAGEIKKSIFTVMNYLMPQQGVLPMHCSANIGVDNDCAIFFGLSGTGKTTLSTDPQRRMIGDDEHGWSDTGVFNFEGGCYAKVINLSAHAEPEIWGCTRRFGTVLENVVMDPVSRRVDLYDSQFTENTRAAYPLSSLTNIQADSMGGHPKHVIFLAADAFGILPPVAQLSNAQAMYHFLSGYTAKLAGTEVGLTTPQATFSACFGAPFMVLDPVHYANMLGQRLEETQARCWLVNTGWSGGPYGEGERMPISETRAIINRILANDLDSCPAQVDPVFGLRVPVTVPGVDRSRLNPRNTWQDPQAYDEKARLLAGQFKENFRQFSDRVPETVRACGPA